MWGRLDRMIETPCGVWGGGKSLLARSCSVVVPPGRARRKRAARWLAGTTTRGTAGGANRNNNSPDNRNNNLGFRLASARRIAEHVRRTGPSPVPVWRQSPSGANPSSAGQVGSGSREDLARAFSTLATQPASTIIGYYGSCPLTGNRHRLRIALGPVNGYGATENGK